MIKLDYGCRWEEAVEAAINKVGAVELLFIDYHADYQGDMDLDVLLSDGRVFSYHYWYGSCSECDPWEGEYNEDADEGLVAHILAEATFFDDKDQYLKWARTVKRG